MRTNPIKTTLTSKQGGFSLIEALVALLVLSIGLLGLAMLQVQGMQFNSSAYMRTQATILAYDIIERMRINRVAAGNNAYSAGFPTGSVKDCAASQDCNTTELAAYDLYHWRVALTDKLPLDPAAAFPIVKAGNDYTITLKWIERDLPITQKWEFTL